MLGARGSSRPGTSWQSSPPPGAASSHVTRHTSHVTRDTVSRLGKLVRAETIEKVLELCDEFTPGDPPEYFFDRNPDNFPAILNMYRTGVLCTS